MLALARSQVLLGVLGNGAAILLAGEALACSNGVCAPFVLIAPLNPAAFGCSDGVCGPVCFLFPIPCPLPTALGLCTAQGHTGTDCGKTRSLQSPAPQHLLQSSAFLPRVGRAFPVGDKVPAKGTGQPWQSPQLSTAHGALGLNTHSSVLHPWHPRPGLPWPPASPTPTGSARGLDGEKGWGLCAAAEGGKLHW